jgi:hypothetical protein
VSSEDLQRIIDDLARHSRGRSISTTRAELVVRLQEAGIAAPSESWLDAVSREAVHGRPYVVDVRHSPVEKADDPNAARSLREAPALLPIVQPATGRPPASATRPAGDADGPWQRRMRAVKGSDLAVLTLLAASVLVALLRGVRRHRRRGHAR